ncbi:MAG: hypothetical protein A2Z20_03435 [Bdellovibrionales bacterium RBG_16_40_8]|nr:MAG: hypothetical protein A2Z20_03435 [Bdellovibrionales bacterium RBG_16_40_8]
MLAKRSSVPKATLHGWVTGRKALKLEQVRMVADALEVSFYWLIFGEQERTNFKTTVTRPLFKGIVKMSLEEII